MVLNGNKEDVMKKLLIVLGGMALAGCAASSSVVASSAPSQTPSQTLAEVTPSPEAPPSPPAKPEGRYGVASCNVASSNYTHLIGSTRVINTGSVPLTAEVTFVWQNGDGSKVTANPKTVTVSAGNSKLVFFNTAVQGVEAQLNFQSNPDYFHGNKACSSKVMIRN